MAKVSIILFVLLMLFNKTYCQVQYDNEDSIRALVNNFNYSDYIGKPIKNLLNVEPIKRYKKYSFIDRKSFVLSGLMIGFTDEVFIDIYVADIRFQPAFNNKRNWSFRKLQKEKISKIKVYNGRKVLKEF